MVNIIRRVAVTVLAALIVPAVGTGFPAAASQQDGSQDLQRAIQLVEEGDFPAAAALLEAITAGEEEDLSSQVSDMVLAYFYLGIARLYLSGDDEARAEFYEALRRDPAFQPALARLPRYVGALWEEARALGALTVVTEPAGAAVYVDGELKGYTPVDVALLAAGEHRVTLTMEGFVDDSRVVAVAPGRGETLQVELTPTLRESAAAEEGSFDRLMLALNEGDRITVTDSFGRDVQGQVIDLSASTLSLRIQGIRVDLSGTEVSVIRQRQRDSLRNGALWGFLSASVTIAALLPLDGVEYTPWEVLAIPSLYGLMGAAVGAFVDSRIRDDRIIYTAARSERRVKVGPLVSRGRRGVALSLGF